MQFFALLQEAHRAGVCLSKSQGRQKGAANIAIIIYQCLFFNILLLLIYAGVPYSGSKSNSFSACCQIYPPCLPVNPPLIAVIQGVTIPETGRPGLKTGFEEARKHCSDKATGIATCNMAIAGSCTEFVAAVTGLVTYSAGFAALVRFEMMTGKPEHGVVKAAMKAEGAGQVTGRFSIYAP